MSRAIVGFRRLFRPLGCSLGEGASLTAQGRVGRQLRAEIYLGAEPTWGTQQLLPGDRYMLPGVPVNMARGSNAAEGVDHPFFVETLVWSEAEFPEATLTASATGDTTADGELLRAAETFQPRLDVAVDVLAGLLGLRFHRQFVLVELTSSHFAIVGDRFISRLIGQAVENLELVTLNQEGRKLLIGLPSQLEGVDDDLLLGAGEVLAWLRRAWGEVEPVAKFVSLFVPLEMVLNGVAVPEPTTDEKNRRQVLDLIRKSKLPHKNDLEGWTKQSLQRRSPSLGRRFEQVARSAALSGWEADVKAFNQLNRRRNALLHRGVVSSATSHVVVGKDEVRSLEDLTERYVCLAICGDARVYRSEWRVGPT